MELLDPVITDYSNSKEIPWKHKSLNLELILLRTVQTVGAHIEFDLTKKDLMWKKVNDMFFNHSVIKEFKLSHLKSEINNGKNKCYRKLMDKYDRILLEAKNFVDKGNTSIMDGNDRSDLFKEVEAIEIAISVANELKLEREADVKVRKDQKAANKKQKEGLDESSNDIIANGKLLINHLNDLD